MPQPPSHDALPPLPPPQVKNTQPAPAAAAKAPSEDSGLRAIAGKGAVADDEAARAEMEKAVQVHTP
jgi:hypothetical protein